MTTRLPSRKLSEVLKRAPPPSTSASALTGGSVASRSSFNKAKNLYDLNISLTSYQDFYHLDPFPGGAVTGGHLPGVPFASNKKVQERPPQGLPGVDYGAVKGADGGSFSAKKPKPGTRRNFVYAEQPSRKWTSDIELWTIYKPPFVPRRSRSAAADDEHGTNTLHTTAQGMLRDPTLSSIQPDGWYNHGVSVEGYLKREAALRTAAAREVVASCTRASSDSSGFVSPGSSLSRQLAAAEANLRYLSGLTFTVPFDMDDRVSGACLVMVGGTAGGGGVLGSQAATGTGSGISSAQAGLPTVLVDTLRQGAVLTFDMLIHGHHKKNLNDDVSLTMLYPKKMTENPWEQNHMTPGSSDSSAVADLLPGAKYSVYSHGYYGPYPVSKVGLTITSPIAMTKPSFRTFVSSVFGSHIVGDLDTSLYGVRRVDKAHGAKPTEVTTGSAAGDLATGDSDMDDETLKELRAEQQASEVGQRQLSDAAHFGDSNSAGNIGDKNIAGAKGTSFPRYMVHCRGISIYDTLGMLEKNRIAIDNALSSGKQNLSPEEYEEYMTMEKAGTGTALKTVLSSSCLRALPELGATPQPITHIRIRDGRWHPMK